MTTCAYYLDKRTLNKRNEAQVKIRICKERKSFYVNTGVWILPTQWDNQYAIIHDRNDADTLNKVIKAVMAQAERYIADLKITEKLHLMSPEQLKDHIMEKMCPDKAHAKRKKNSFLQRFIEFTESKEKHGTKHTYVTTLNRMMQYDTQLEYKSFEDIDIKWLQGFDDFLKAFSPSANARAIKLRNIRAVFNNALDDEITNAYPFRKFKIRTTKTRHRNLSLQEVRLLRDSKCASKRQEECRDMFMLMIYLVGINAVDLLTPGHATIKNGRIEYFRTKTQKNGAEGKFVSIKIEPEAQQLLNKYKGKKRLLKCMDKRESYKSFLKLMDVELKKIGTSGADKNITPIFHNLSQYWCRHTWASLAAEIDIPTDTIARALSHSNGNETTNIYIDTSLKKIDEANRKVLDYIAGVANQPTTE